MDQVRGTATFEQACDDLRFRCEALRADDLLHSAGQTNKVRGLIANGETVSGSSPGDAGTTPSLALITTADQRQNRGAARKKEMAACLVKGCETLTPPHLRLCKRCYHECVAGKSFSLQLKTGEKITYDLTTQKIVFPPSVVAATKGSRATVKAAVTFVPGTSSPQ